MPGYWDMLQQRGPSLLEMAKAAGLTKAQRDARADDKERFEFAKQQAIAEQQASQQAAETARRASEAAQQAKAEEAKRTRTANEERYWAQMLQSRPQDAARIIPAARARGIEIAAEPMQVSIPGEQPIQAMPRGPELATSEAASRSPEIAQTLQARASGVLGAPKVEDAPDAKMSTYARQLVEAEYEPGSDDFIAEMKRYNAATLKKMERTPQGMTINLGGSAAAPKVKADQQQAMIDVMQTSEMLDDLEDMATVKDAKGQPVLDAGGNPTVNFGQFLGTARLKNWTLAQLDKIDMVPQAERAQFERAQEFRAVLDKYRSEEYRRLLGSAQSESEIKNLVNSVISADMGSTQFAQAFRALRRATARNERIARKVLSEGFDIGSDEYKQRFSELEGERGRPTAQARQSPQSSTEAAFAEDFPELQ